MAKTGGAVQKLSLKMQQRSTRLHKGTFKPLIARIDATYHEKVVAMKVHREMIHGREIVRRDGTIDHVGGGINPTAVFEGTGLPDEVTVKAPKTNQERAAADKRNSLKSEWRDGFRPQAWAGRRWS